MSQIRIDEPQESLEEEIQYFQIFKNSTTIMLSRSLVELEMGGEGTHLHEEIYGTTSAMGGFAFPDSEEAENEELVRDVATGKYFERFVLYSGSRVLAARLKKVHDNISVPLFLDLERDDIVLHLEKQVVFETMGNVKAESKENSIEHVIRSPVMRLNLRFHDSVSDTDSQPAVASSSGASAFTLSITAVDVVMLAAIISLVLLLLLMCIQRPTDHPLLPSLNKCSQVMSRLFRRHPNPRLIPENS